MNSPSSFLNIFQCILDLWFCHGVSQTKEKSLEMSWLSYSLLKATVSAIRLFSRFPLFCTDIWWWVHVLNYRCFCHGVSGWLSTVCLLYVFLIIFMVIFVKMSSVFSTPFPSAGWYAAQWSLAAQTDFQMLSGDLQHKKRRVWLIFHSKCPWTRLYLK